MEPPRLRLKFIGRQILSESQQLDGLKRSWVLLKPRHETVSDVALHILHTFDLYNSCPDGLILSMDGFVLPSFVSTTILKDRDLICVKRKGVRLINVIKEHEEVNTLVDKNVVKQPTGMKLLANEEFVKEMEGYESETEEEEESQHDELEETMPNGYATLKKRKASKKLKSSTRKRLRKLAPENDEISPQMRAVDSRSCSTECTKKSSKNRIERDEVQTPEVPNKERNKNVEGTVIPSSVPDEPKQCSRSAWRKSARRLWQRYAKKAEKESTNFEVHNKQSHEGDLNGDMGSTKEENVDTCKNQQPDEEIDSEEELVPVVIRPGHIRFAPSGKEKEVQQIGLEKELYQWNGILSKKKGQKWGKEKQQSAPKLNEWVQEKKSTSRWKGWAQEKQSMPDHNEWVQDNQNTSKWNRQDKEKKSTPGWNDYKSPSRNYSNNRANKKAPAANDTMDFEKLVPMTDFPVQGDVIAYRLLVLSSSWCPELSSYRVGKVSWFEPKSIKVMLVPVPEYPFDFEKRTDDNASKELPTSSHYKEDGSLEIDFPSLADVRIIKHGDLNPEAVHQMVSATPVAKNFPCSKTAFAGQTPSQAQLTSNSTVANSSAPVNGDTDVWEEISKASSVKKAQLLQEDNWKQKASPSNRSWSYRTLRSSALGPTMALLRARNRT